MRRLCLSGISTSITASLVLCGCGGGSGEGPTTTSTPSYSVGGTVSGLVGTGLTLEDSVAGSLAVAGNGRFTLPKALPSGTSYAVAIAQQPSNPTQKCALTGGAGVIDGANASGVSVTCAEPQYPIGVVLSGLLGSSITIENNGSDKLTLSANGRFAFASLVSSGGTYTVSIVTQPGAPPQYCSLQGGSGTVGASSPSVSITCASTVLTSRQIDFVSGSLGAVVADTSRNRIYVAATSRNEVVVLDATSYLVLSHFFVGSSPQAMVLSSDSSILYVGLSQGGAVVLVNPDTQTVTTTPVATAMGTSFVTSLVELKPGVLLVGGAGYGTGTAESGYGNLMTLTIATRAMQPVAAGFAIENVAALIRGPDGRRVYGIGYLYGMARQEVLFSLDATLPSMPLIATALVDGVNNIAISQDGAKILADTGAIFDATALGVLSAGADTGFGAVGGTQNDSLIASAVDASALAIVDGSSFVPLVAYTDDCPGEFVTSMTAAPATGTWIIGTVANLLCVVSTTNAASAPGAAGSRALPPNEPPITMVPWVEISEPANSAVIDNTRGVAYVANGAGTVDIFSLAQGAFVGSISVPGKPQVVTLSSDGTTLYAGLFDVGAVVTIDRSTNTVTNSVNLTSALGTADILRIAEISPGHVLVSSSPSEGGVGPNTYLVDVVLSNPGSAQRVGCASGYQGALPVVSPDGHYLYILGYSACAIGEKRDLTQPSYPVVVSGPLGGYGEGDGMPVLTPDGAYLISGGVIIDTNTMQQTANYFGGLALASSNPDRYYLVSGQNVLTMELHDLKVLSFVQNECQSVIDETTDATISADEKTVISLAAGYGAICETQIAP